MAHAAESPWPRIAAQAWEDLQPFPGRFGMAWRVALLCALVAAVAMIYKVPESAIGCYLVIFLMRPDGAECVGQSIGLIILASVVVLAMAPVIQATADTPLLRVAVIAGTSFAFLFLSSASQLGEIGAIIALVIAFILTLVDQVPAGEVVTRGLLYAWQMAVMPMALMAVFCLVFGTSPHRLLRRTVTERLAAAADALETHAPEGMRRLDAQLSEGSAESDKQVMLARLFHTAPAASVTWLFGAVATSYRLLLAVAALPADLSAEVRTALARQCRNAAASISAHQPPAVEEQPIPSAPGALAAARAALAGLAQPNGGTDAVAAKPPFLSPDAFTNPDHQRYALKTTAAAVACYLIYSLIDWQGIHTAMITCYVAALGTTGETVHKLALRICGCLVGAVLGIGSILFVIPHLDSVGGLMALVFAAILVAGWVSSGPERISYAGVQIGLAFLLTVLNGFGPSHDMDAARDRIIGILLGNTVVYVIFTGIWSKSAVTDVRERLARTLAALARLARLDPEARAGDLADAVTVATETARAREQLDLLPFEPRSQQPPEADQARLAALIEETRALLPALMFSIGAPEETARRLARAADLLGNAGSARETAPLPDTDALGDALAGRVRRIEQLAEGARA